MSLIGSTNAEKIWNFCKSKGMNDFGAAGVVANLYAESALNPMNLQDSYQRILGFTDESYTVAVDNGTYTNFVNDSAGYGLAQWTLNLRKSNFLQYSKSANRSIGDLELQLNFLYKELTENYASLLNTLKTAKSISEASNAFMLKYECPYDQSVSAQNIRTSFGQKYYDLFVTNRQINNITNNNTIGANTVSFKMRTTKPSAGNKYYITKANGGYSNAIKGKPMDKDCDVLSNCVGYAYGRFNEIGGYGYCKYLSPVNAENFMQYKGSLKTGQTPKVGACMVWQRGNTLSNSDGAGHVAIVEKVISSTQVMTSESAYGGSAFYNKNRNKGSGNWGMGADYKFLGFIYNPAVNNSNNATNNNYTTTSTTTNNKSVWTVKKNETLSFIAKECGTTWQILAKYNNISNPNMIKVGQKIKIPPVLVGNASVKITADLLNVRAGAGTKYKVLATVKKNSTHKLLEEKDGWGRISKGWISSTYYKKL